MGLGLRCQLGPRIRTGSGVIETVRVSGFTYEAECDPVCSLPETAYGRCCLELASVGLVLSELVTCGPLRAWLVDRFLWCQYWFRYRLS